MNRLISKGMSNFYFWEKWRSQNFDFLGKKISRNALASKSKTVEVIFGETFILAFIQISYNLFCMGDNRLLSEFLRKWGWFHGHNERFPKYLGWKLKFQKIETRFCRWKSNDYNNNMIFLSLKNTCYFLLAKEKTWKSIFNTNNKLSQNRTKKQIMPFKTTANWLFNDIWCYLVMVCFDWKIGVFQQTVVRVYILNENVSFTVCEPRIQLSDSSKLAINWKMTVTSQFVNMMPSSNSFDIFLFLLSSLVTGPSFMSMSSLVLEMWQFSFIRDWPKIQKLEIPLVWVLSNIWRLG